MVKHGKKDNSTMPTHPQGFQPLTWQEYVACQISIGSNLIQQRNLRDLNGLFDTSGIKVILEAKLMDVIGYYALNQSLLLLQVHKTHPLHLDGRVRKLLGKTQNQSKPSVCMHENCVLCSNKVSNLIHILLG
jgi:hypothetical protein